MRFLGRNTDRNNGKRRRIQRRSTVLQLECLEDRSLMTIMHPAHLLQHPSAGLTPRATAAPQGVSPITMRHAYGSDAVSFNGVSGDGSGQTIAIVDAYDEPTMSTDLAAFNAKFGLPTATLIKVNQTGGAKLPAADTKGGWGTETALDVEWAHAMAPKATILLVEANSANDADLYQAVDTARNYPGVTTVSMSWGADEASTDSANDSYFTTPSGHAGVSFFSSSGDNGAYSDSGSTTKIVGYPAVSPNVVAVGGTLLTTGSGNSYVSESGWGSGATSRTDGGSGGGISKYFSQPSYQKGTVTQSTTKRTVPDIAFDADPTSGASIYDAYDNGASTPWDVIGGTSLASPMWAGVMAVANQGRALQGLNSLDGATGLLPKLYQLPSTDFHDITTGNNGYAAAAGYDLVTGRGTPIVNKLVGDLVGSTTTPGTPVIGSFAVNPTSVVIGSPYTLTASNVTETGGTITSVSFYRDSNGVSGLQTATDKLVGVGTPSGTTWTLNASTTGFPAGSYTYYAVAKDAAGVSSAPLSTILTVTSTATVTGQLAGWSVTGQSSFGTQGLKATQVAAGLTNSLGLTRGSGVTTTTTAASNAWGGSNWATTSSAGISGNHFVTFGFTVSAGQKVSLSSLDLNYRHSSSGPTSGYWQYQVNGGAWNLIGDFANQFSTSASSGGAITEMNLGGIAGLQNLAAGTVVNVRLTPYGASSTGGTWYIYDRTGNDLIVNGSVSAAAAIRPAFSQNSTAIANAIAKVPTSAGAISSTTVVDFGKQIYSGALDVTNTLNRIRAGSRSLDANDGAIFDNSKGVLPRKNTWYEFVVDPKTGTDHNFSGTVQFPGPMRLILNTDGTCYFTGDHYASYKLVYNPSASSAPTIGSFSASPNSVAVGSTTTLTASNVSTSSGSISAVKFYRESNGTSGLQIGSDTLVGTGVANGKNWTLSTATTGFAAGTYTYYAVATSSANVSSVVSSTVLTVTGNVASGSLLAWSATGQTNFGTQGLLAGQVAGAVVNSQGLTRGAGVTTAGTAASNAWGGSNWATTSSAGITGNESISFSLTVNPSEQVSLSAIDLNYRRSSSGPANGYWQYKLNSGAWNLIGDFANEFANSTSSGGASAEIKLGGIAALQHLAAGTVVTIRLTPYGASSTGGTFYIYDLAGSDLLVKGVATPSPAPLFLASQPANGATASPVTASGNAIAIPVPPTSSDEAFIAQIDAAWEQFGLEE